MNWPQEARAKDMINQLKLEMNNLTRLVEAGAGLSIGEEATMNELLKQKEELTAERDSQVSPLQAVARPHTIKALLMSLEIVNTSCAPRHSLTILASFTTPVTSSSLTTMSAAKPLLMSRCCPACTAISKQYIVLHVLQAEC